MADPISVAAIAGLVYAGRKLSQPKETYTLTPRTTAAPTIEPMYPIEPVKEYPIRKFEAIKTSLIIWELSHHK